MSSKIMTLLDAHLEQIALCSQSITELPFPPAKIFTNALLAPHDITALIRDTEIHERALFSVPPTPKTPSEAARNRRTTTFASNDGGPGVARAPRRNTAVAAVLGGDLVERIRRGGGGGVGSGLGYRDTKGEVDVEVLLEGAEKLCGVYPIPGSAAKIASLRERHRQLAESIAHYEERVADQTAELSRMNKPRDFEDEDEAADYGQAAAGADTEYVMTTDDMKREEEEIRELEAKKRALEDRVGALGRDLTGVLR